MSERSINQFRSFLESTGVEAGQHVIVHSAYSRIRDAFEGISPEQVINVLKDIVTPGGSVIMPVFTYCFKKKDNSHEIFDRVHSPSKTGALTEVFRNSPDVIRTSSPTHSFAIYGKAAKEIDAKNSPESPLGEGSVMEWLTHQDKSHVLMLGTDFSSLTYIHYIEIKAPVPWFDYSPWDYMDVEPYGVSVDGTKPLKELPGCAKSFVSFETCLLKSDRIKPHRINGFRAMLIPIEVLYKTGKIFLKERPLKLLCPAGTCRACDTRRIHFLK